MSTPPCRPADIPLASGASGPSVPAVTWADPAREAAFTHWLDRIAAREGLDPASLRPASADASFRRYLRIDTAGGAGTRIVMDAPPAQEDCRPFVKVAALMRGAGLHVPRILDWDEAAGFMLLEDLGRQTMIEVVDAADPPANQGLYLRAVDALVAWQAASTPGVLPPYDKALLERELQLFPEWYLGRHRGVVLEGKDKDTFDSAMRLIVQQNLSAQPVYVHRDFMPRNLMIPPDAYEPRLGVLDFQDAVYGPITYDIASLMRDAFLSWDEEFVLDITVRYWKKAQQAGLPVDSDFGEFWRGVEWMGLQRHLKVAGIFARLTLRDGKPKYLADAPRFLGYIRATATRYRALGPLAKVLDRIEGTEDAQGFAFGRV